MATRASRHNGGYGGLGLWRRTCIRRQPLQMELNGGLNLCQNGLAGGR